MLEIFLDWSLPHMLSPTINIHCIEPSSLFFSKPSSKKLFSQILKNWRLQCVPNVSTNLFQGLNITTAECAPAYLDSKESCFLVSTLGVAHYAGNGWKQTHPAKSLPSGVPVELCREGSELLC